MVLRLFCFSGIVRSGLNTSVVALALAVVGCSGSHSTTPTVSSVFLETPKSLSPGLIVPPPMVQTAILPPSAMQSPSGSRPQSAIQGSGFTLKPGSASYASAAPDGSLWVLSTLPEGPDKYIWHYTTGWTNITGLASRIAVAPDGSLYATNSGGSAYHYANGTWTGLGGGVSDITAAMDGSLYVLSNGYAAGSNQPIWHYKDGWSQIAGAGVRIAASQDIVPHFIPAGAVPAGGLYVLSETGAIYYTPGNGSYIRIPGEAAAIAPSSGGFFVLGYPTSGDGSSIYYYDLDSPGWIANGGSGVSISASGSQLYVVSSTGAIYSMPLLPPAAPAGFMRQVSASSVSGTLGTGIATALAVAISETGDQDTSGRNGVFANGFLNVAAGIPTGALQVQAAAGSATAPRNAGNSDTWHQGAPDGPSTVRQMRQLLLQVPHSSAGPPGRRALSSTIGSNPTVGAVANIWTNIFTIGSSTGTYVQVPSTLEYQGLHTNVWIDNSLITQSPSFGAASLAATVAAVDADFENAYASDTAHFAYPDYSPNAPALQLAYNGYDSAGAFTGKTVSQYITEPGDHRVNLLLLGPANLGKGLGGYFSSTNYIPQSVLNYFITKGETFQSNEAPFIYCGWVEANGANFELNEDLVRSIAHELQHLINFVNHSILPPAASGSTFDGSEDAFVNEGLSMLSQDFAVNRLHPGQQFDVADAMARAAQFINSPHDYSLSGFIGRDPTSWGGDGASYTYNCGGGCYGSAYLFQRYLYDRFGGDAYISGMERSGLIGFANLQQNSGNEPAPALIGDFALALATSSLHMSSSTPAFNLGSLTLGVSYTDQFGKARLLSGVSVVNAVAVGGSTNFLAPYGGFAFLNMAPADSEPIFIRDPLDSSGAFGLVGGIAQQKICTTC